MVNQRTASPLYAVIDLGSNSFHMLIARLVADSVQIVDKVKRKVRLASGLDEQQCLTDDAILRGLECLYFFAERLQDIPTENIRIVATATLRIAKNADEFLQQAENILQHPIQLLSGEQEAEQIYLGVAHTNCSANERLVFDIGGASTEIVVGENFTVHHKVSLNIGCVTLNQRFFPEQQLSVEQFNQAKAYAMQLLHDVAPSFRHFQWQSVLGGSGTMQALAEILAYRQQPAIINRQFLSEISQQLLTYRQFSQINFGGLTSERLPVFVSGVVILAALFETFNVEELQLSSGAIREGLLYEMLPNMRAMNIRQRTIASLTERFHIDYQHANRVQHLMRLLFGQLKQPWRLAENNLFSVLNASCLLHEVGLLLEYKNHQQHSAYILQHAELPGFDQGDRQLLVALVKHYKREINLAEFQQQLLCNELTALQLLLLLRLSVILCRRRQDDVLPQVSLLWRQEQQTVVLQLPDHWLKLHPLITDELSQEISYWQSLPIKLALALKSD
jgi:exopolyphosphatase/guanosine-5'-triphosphate,3'-diphosphate pyrophosphatase